jgi:pimeloyl-ACP methyl ester carboxylesterase
MPSVKLRRALQIATVFAGIGGGVSLRRFAKRIEYHTDENDLFTVGTDDGWELDGARYRPRADPFPRPVVLVAGFGQNRALFDLGRGASLARFLADAGFDTYTVNLRGRGSHRTKGQWTFDDHAAHDVPAIVATVRELSGADGVFWLGVDLAGQAIYAAALDGHADGVLGAITLSAPAGFPKDAIVPGLNAPPLGRAHGRIQFRAAVRRLGPALALARSEHRLDPSLRALHTDPVTAARYLTHGVSDEATNLGDQLTRWIHTQAMVDEAGRHIWSDHLREFTLPILALVGSHDQRAPAAAVEKTVEHLGSADKTLVIAGREHGNAQDYGHFDLVIGRAARIEIWPAIVDWLTEHRDAAPAGPRLSS